MRPARFELATSGLGNRCSKEVNPENTGTYETPQSQLTAELTADSPKRGEIDIQTLPSDLAQIVAAWPNLPEYIKAAIMALVKTV